MFGSTPLDRAHDGPLSAELHRANMRRAQDDEITARFARRSDELFGSVKGASYRVMVDEAEHMDFAARAPNQTIYKSHHTVRERR